MSLSIIDLHVSTENSFNEINGNNRSIELKEKYEQYYTPTNIANYMAAMFKPKKKKSITMLDPGVGMGSLTIAFVRNVLEWDNHPVEIKALLYEIDETVKFRLEENLSELKEYCLSHGVTFQWELKFTDFISDSVEKILRGDIDIFDYVILNPPYRKMVSGSKEDDELRGIGIQSANYYAAFVSLSKRYLKQHGEYVAITPRSFCNGVYFLPYRKDMELDTRYLDFHLFDSRTSPFSKDQVLQETIIYHGIKEIWDSNKYVNVLHSTDSSFSDTSKQLLKLEEIVYPSDANRVIRILRNGDEKQISDRINALPCTLKDIGLDVSTGPIVGFREKSENISKDVVENSYPYLYSKHIKNGAIVWPLNDAKNNSIIGDDSNLKRLRNRGNYVLVKRMSSKEERRRIICGVLKASDYNYEYFGFDNKTNYYHRNKSGFELEVTKGLCVFLSASLVDIYFRTFSGHTQVNASDLKSLRYPTINDLKELSSAYDDESDNQDSIDRKVEEIIKKYHNQD
ncbi:Eco57I restriction-modification methylase domain-containing protein [Acetoanaerobium sticklandii]|uniref:Eco57I restriction-modification methylase domain-containing protein n=1 Tax=Acetoanaerobium sticklandii TaxID=1511 RepID=UPI0012FEEB86|nr:N-6 DNA methylase [Acetoanaerobium sticklandii]